MSIVKDLSARKCAPCEGGVPPLTAAQAKLLAKQLHKDWQIAADSKSLKRSLKFKDFYRTMSFVNALAHVANTEDHHPDLSVGYNYCRRHVLHALHRRAVGERFYLCGETRSPYLGATRRIYGVDATPTFVRSLRERGLRPDTKLGRSLHPPSENSEDRRLTRGLAVPGGA